MDACVKKRRNQSYLCQCYNFNRLQSKHIEKFRIILQKNIVLLYTFKSNIADFSQYCNTGVTYTAIWKFATASKFKFLPIIRAYFAKHECKAENLKFGIVESVFNGIQWFKKELYLFIRHNYKCCCRSMTSNFQL